MSPSSPPRLPPPPEERRDPFAIIRDEVAEIAGEVAAIDANVERLHTRLAKLDDKLDTLIGIKSKADDHTAEIKVIKEELKKAMGWREKMGWVYGGVMTGVAGVITVLSLLGKL